MGITQEQIQGCVAISREFGAKRLVLFGSALEAPETARDLDVACEGVRGWDVFRLGARLEEELGVRVDLIPIEPDDRFSQHVAARGKVIYERE